MDTLMPGRFPNSMPEVRIEVLEEGTDQSVLCDELQWWFVVPRPGETTAARWYDWASGRITRARETDGTVTPLEESPDCVRFGIRETTFPMDDGAPTESTIRFTARLTSESAAFLSVEIDGALSDSREEGFAESWGDARDRLLRDGGRLVRTGPREYRSARDQGARADLIALSLGGVTRRALRFLDLEPGAEPWEFGQALIDLETGRTLAYWQYRPEGWDEDASAWWAAHPAEGITIDGVRFQRRSCTGRDEIALTNHALSLFAL